MAIQVATQTGSHGQTATTSNTSMVAWVASGGTAVFDNFWMPRGKVSLKATGTATNGALYGRQSFAPAMELAYEFPYRPAQWPDAGNDPFLRLASNNANTRGIEVGTDANGALVVRDAPFTIPYQSANGAMAIQDPCLVSVFVAVGAGTGKIRVVVYEEDEVTIRLDSGMLLNQDTGSVAIDSARVLGTKVSTSARTPIAYFGEPRWDDEATDIMPTMAPPVSTHKIYKRFDGSSLVPVKLQRFDGSTLTRV